MQESDCKTVYEWANDPVARSMSLNTEHIEWPDHQKWFATKLADQACMFLAARDGDHPVGQVRFDDCDSETTTVSLAIAPAQRQQGYGAATLHVALRLLANTRECLSRIPADKLDWKAHEKSYDLRSLATHIANMPKWTVMTLDETSFDMEPEGEEPITEDPVESVEGAL